MNRRAALMTTLCCALLLSGCASESLAGRTLAAVGIGKTEPAQASKPRKLALRLDAGAKLNLDAQGRPLALLVRIYQLRQRIAFEGAPYAAFLAPGGDSAALGPDLVAAREITLVPGQRYEVVETAAREAAFVGIVALFHGPAPGRWRAVFDALDAEKAGITIGLQACAMSVGAGAQPVAANPAAAGPAHCD